MLAPRSPRGSPCPGRRVGSNEPPASGPWRSPLPRARCWERMGWPRRELPVPYLQSILQSLPLFVLLTVALVTCGEGNELWRPIAVGLSVGVVLGLLSIRPLRRSLREETQHWVIRGGNWFLVLLGAGCVLWVVLWSNDRRLAIDLGLGASCVAASFFAVIGCWVWREERRQGKTVWMSRGGLEFREPK